MCVIEKSAVAASLTAALILSTACTSNGSHRVAGIGTYRGESSDSASQAGPQGPAGTQGPAGAQGPQGAPGDDSQNTGLGDAGALATGGLIGPNGLANTGLFANTGQPGTGSVIITGVLVKSGDTVNYLGGKGLKVAQLIDAKTPGNLTIAGTVLGVLPNAGKSLIQTGEGQEYLVDGLLTSPGEVVTATIGEAYLLGSKEAQPLIGASILSPHQQHGDLLIFGGGSNGELVKLNIVGKDTDTITGQTLPAPQIDNLVSGNGSNILSGAQDPKSEALNKKAETLAPVGNKIGGLLGKATQK